jgi:hypothetical protein
MAWVRIPLSSILFVFLFLPLTSAKESALDENRDLATSDTVYDSFYRTERLHKKRRLDYLVCSFGMKRNVYPEVCLSKKSMYL